MGFFSNIFGGNRGGDTPVVVPAAQPNADGTIPVQLTTTLDFAKVHNVEPGTTAAQLLQSAVPGFEPNRYVIKKEYRGADGTRKKESITADYVLVPGDHVSAVTPKNVSGA